jgi:hypothetical protein
MVQPVARTVRMDITDDTTPELFDAWVTQAYAPKEMLRLRIHTTQCSRVSYANVLCLKRVLDTHRASTRKYLVDTTVVVKSPLVRHVLCAALLVIRNEKPVRIVVG